MALASPSRGDVIVIASVAMLAVAFLIALTKFPGLGFGPRGNAGFGPGWQCTAIPESDQVCIKKVPK